MLSEEMRNYNDVECEYILAIFANKVAKYERVVRAARTLDAEYDYFNNDLSHVWDELEAALVDLPEGAPG